jgi:phosphohistidine phosphatase SixA
MRQISMLLLAFALLPWLTATADDRAPESASTATFVVLRHAEKATDDPRDPTLTEAGQRRAQMIAELLSERELNAVYSSDYRRTRETAAVSAEQFGLATILYDPSEAAGAFADRLQSAHHSGVVLIVGHSNTVPELVAALCRCEVDAIDESEYGDWFEVSTKGGVRRLMQQRY